MSDRIFIKENFSPSILYKEMKERGLSVSSLSLKSTVSERQIYKYLRGEQKPREKTIDLISKAMGLNSNDFDGSKESSIDREFFDVIRKNRRSKSLPRHENIKAVFFDLNGTLTINKGKSDLTTWELIWLQLGYDLEECQAYHGLFNRGKITHKKWCKITLNKFKEKGLTLDHFSEIAKKAPLIDDAIETIEKIKEKGLHVELLSDSVDSYAEFLMPDYNNLFHKAHINKFKYDPKTKIIKNIKNTEYGFSKKRTRIEEYCEETNTKIEDVLFVGNSGNDISVTKTDAITVVVNPTRVDYQDFRIKIMNTKTISPILDIIGI